MTAKLSTTILLALFLLTGCMGGKMTWADLYNFPGSEWPENEKIVFIPDSSLIVGNESNLLSMYLRYGDGIEFEELPLVVKIKKKEEKVLTDTFVLKLFQNNEIKRNSPVARHGVFESNIIIKTPTPIENGDTIEVFNFAPSRKLSDTYTLGLITVNKK